MQAQHRIAEPGRGVHPFLAQHHAAAYLITTSGSPVAQLYPFLSGSPFGSCHEIVLVLMVQWMTGMGACVACCPTNGQKAALWAGGIVAGVCHHRNEPPCSHSCCAPQALGRASCSSSFSHSCYRPSRHSTTLLDLINLVAAVTRLRFCHGTKGHWEGWLELHASDVAMAIPAGIPEDHTLCSSEVLNF